MTARLLDERVVAVQPSLVAAFGSAALVLQQVHFHAQGPHQLDHDGERWWRLDPEQYGRETGLSVHQVRRAIQKLEGEFKVLKSCAPGGYDRTKFHRIDYSHDAFTPVPQPSGDSASSTAQDCDHEDANSHALLTKTSGYLEAAQDCEICDNTRMVDDHVCECFTRRSVA